MVKAFQEVNNYADPTPLFPFHASQKTHIISENTDCIPGKTHPSIFLLLQLPVKKLIPCLACQGCWVQGRLLREQGEFFWSLTQPHITLPRGAQFLSEELTTPGISNHKGSLWCLTGLRKRELPNCSPRAQITQQHHLSNPNSCRPRDWTAFAGSRAVPASIGLTTNQNSLKSVITCSF